MPATNQASINTTVTPPQSFNDVLRRTSDVLLEAEVPMILWGGECTYPVRNSSRGDSKL
jgi:hypothetical protein